jgi:hypothetical protein
MHKDAQKLAHDPAAVGRGSVVRHAQKCTSMHNHKSPLAIATEAIKGLICFFTLGAAQECTTMHSGMIRRLDSAGRNP